MRKTMRFWNPTKTLWPLTLFLAGCVGIPEKIAPVENLDAERYLGTWYEIARLDHSFERGLEQVTATYSRRDDGGITVFNRGFKTKSGKWTDAEGKAYFVGDSDVGHLKVSFFGPFYSSYVIFDLDSDYQTAYIAGFNHNYLWLLSRTPQIDDDAKARFVKRAEDSGFDLESLIWVRQPSVEKRP